MRRTVFCVYTLGFLVSFLANWVWQQYYSLDTGALLVFPGNDANCRIGEESIGIHCFGDFSAIRFGNPFDKPTGAELVYPLSARIVRLPFFLLESISSYRFSLIAFLIVGIGACIYPLLHAMRDLPPAIRIGAAALLGLTNVGSLAALDRGNIILICVPAVYLFILATDEGKWRRSLLLLCLAVSIKPQLVVLAVIYLWRKRISLFLLSGLLAGVILFLPYIVIGRGNVELIGEWLTELRRWSSSLPASATYPPNISFNRVLVLLDLDFELFGYTIVGVLILVVTRNCWKNKRPPALQEKLALIVSVALSGPIAYIYYLVLLIPAVALLVKQQHHDDAGNQTLQMSNDIPILLCVALIPAAIPSALVYGGTIGPNGIFSVWPTSISTMMLLLLVLLMRKPAFKASPPRKEHR